MRFGRKVLKTNKPIAVIGIGAGPELWYPSKKVVRNVCNHSAVISTRDNESTDFLKRIGVSTAINTCSDVALTFQTDAESSLYRGSEYVFLHTNYQRDVAEKFAEGVKSLLEQNQNIKAIVGADNVVDISEALDVVRQILGEERVVEYKYTYPDELCKLIANCKLVLTYKLHVGILASAMGTSVVAVAKHDKIQRYYRQIGAPNRCISFYNSDSQVVSDLANEYYGKTMEVNSDIRKKAEENWVLLDSFLDSLSSAKLK